jgi:hypothetical protein
MYMQSPSCSNTVTSERSRSNVGKQACQAVIRVRKSGSELMSRQSMEMLNLVARFPHLRKALSIWFAFSADRLISENIARTYKASSS